MSSDVWIGAATTLLGGVVGGAISFFLSWQQVREARRQRQEDAVREDRRRSADRRFQVYADFLLRTRSFRHGAEAYFLQPGHRPSLTELDALLQAANDASALVFLVVEDDATYAGCRHALRALSRARDIIHGIHDAETSVPAEPWAELNALLGQATREFQNSARTELGVSGPAASWEATGRSRPAE